jgi:hypothetical protein
MKMYADKFGIQTGLTTFGLLQLLPIPDAAGARTELHRGFTLKDPRQDRWSHANAWDQLRLGRETSWWPIPPVGSQVSI